jgi:hypothetical protein
MKNVCDPYTCYYLCVSVAEEMRIRCMIHKCHLSSVVGDAGA